MHSAYELYVAKTSRRGRGSPQDSERPLTTNDKANKRVIPKSERLPGSSGGQIQTDDAEPISSQADEEKPIDPKDPLYTTELCIQFKRTLCHDEVTVHFVGAW